MHLIIVDTAQIQSYVFNSNRLRENIGASHLVAQATDSWAKEAVQYTAKKHNIVADGRLDDTKSIENPADNLDAEVLYAGGGNFVVLFRDDSKAKDFIRTLSRKVLTDAPNLQLVVAQRQFNWKESLRQTLKDTFKQLAEEKRSRILSAPLLGLGVTKMCRSTGWPATGWVKKIGDDPERPASSEILAKLRVVDRDGKKLSEADRRLTSILPCPEGYDYPAQLDHLGGTKGEHNFIAVVHADGNGMGQRIMGIGGGDSTLDNREYIRSLRSFSEAVDRASQMALKDVLSKLETRIQNDGGDRIVHRNTAGKIVAEIRLKLAEDGLWYLPFRPVVFGGDDVTFVCDGRLGLSLAIEYIRQLEKHTEDLPDKKGKLTASAGISIVKAHYPFSRAYSLAEELCRKAKKYRRDIDYDASCIDWHFALSGLSGTIEDIRRREYKVDKGSLCLRPVIVGDVKAGGNFYRSWAAVEKSIEELQGENWAERRNKLKALRDALREGPEAVRYFRSKFNEGKPLPRFDTSCTNWEESGWYSGYCGYFDALELVDWFIPL